MTTTESSKSARIRARLNYPVIDADGHASPLGPPFIDYITKVGGSKFAQGYEKAVAADPYIGDLYLGTAKSQEEMRYVGATRGPWWFPPTGSKTDRATSYYPKLMYERLEEMGADYAVLYLGIGYCHFTDDELRRVACRAVNMYYADLYREYADRITVPAVVPMHTPQEAIEELEFAVKELGFKAMVIPGYVRRPIPKIEKEYPELAGDLFHYVNRLDSYGIDSDYDYDPFWAKCVELGVAPTVHSTGMGFTGRHSPSTYMFNHIGMHADAGETFFRSLFFGGVTRRFPTLRFAALEGGVYWGSNMLTGMISRWDKRNGKAMLENQDPAKLDIEGLLELGQRYGAPGTDWARARANMERERDEPRPAILDEWYRCEIEKKSDILDIFVPNFFFGCEADDPMNRVAFDRKINHGARLNAIYGSDISHWDVPDMREALEEAWETVEDGILSEEDFRDLVFTNPVKLWADMNPNFFKGTAIEHEVAKELARLSSSKQGNGAGH